MLLSGHLMYMLSRDWPEGWTSFMVFHANTTITVENLIQALDCGISIPTDASPGIQRELGGVYLLRYDWDRVNELYIIPDSNDPISFILISDGPWMDFSMSIELEGVYNTPQRIAALQALGFTEVPNNATDGVGR